MENFSEQIQRIKIKLPVAKRSDKGLRVFGASSHKYQINKPVSITEIERFEKYASWSSDYQYQANYLKKFQKNLKKVKKLCENSSISYYNFLPGYKVPLEIRSHIVSFISPVHMD